MIPSSDTAFQVYEHVISPDKLRGKMAAGEVRFADLIEQGKVIAFKGAIPN